VFQRPDASAEMCNGPERSAEWAHTGWRVELQNQGERNTMRNKKFFKYLSLFALMMVVICPARAQTIVTGGFSGTITDPTGATVAGAALTLTSSTTGDTYSTVSSSIGGYVFSLLKPGDYTLTTKKDGFRTATQKVTVLLV
jgi:hypothetical protein